MSLLGGFLQTMGTRVFCLAVTVAASVLTARLLGPEGKGILTVLGTLTATLAQFGNLGLTAANVHFAAQRPGERPQLAAVSLWVAVGMGALLAGLALAVSVWRPDLLSEIPLSLLVVAVLSLPFLLASQLLQSLLLGMEAIPAFNLLDVFRTVVGLAVLVVLAGLGWFTVAALVWTSSLLAVLGAAVTWGLIRERSRMAWRFARGFLREMLGYGMVFFLNNLLAFLLLKSDYFLVNSLLGVREVGVYSVAVQIADLLLLVPATVATLLFPRLSAIADTAERTRMCLQCARITAGAMAVGCALVGGLGPWVVAWVWGAAFAPAWVSLVLLLPGVWILTLENVVVMHLAAERLPLAIPVLWLSGLLLNVGLNLWWIPRLGPAGAAMTSSIAYAAVSVGVFWLFQRRTGAGWAALLVPRAEDWRTLTRRLRETLGVRVPAGA